MIPLLLGCLIAIIPATLQGAPEYYTEPQVYGMRPNPDHESEMGPIGATGIEARVYKGVRVTVEEVHPDTPAFGKFSNPRSPAPRRLTPVCLRVVDLSWHG